MSSYHMLLSLCTARFHQREEEPLSLFFFSSKIIGMFVGSSLSSAAGTASSTAFEMSLDNSSVNRRSFSSSLCDVCMVHVTFSLASARLCRAARGHLVLVQSSSARRCTGHTPPTLSGERRTAAPTGEGSCTVE